MTDIDDVSFADFEGQNSSNDAEELLSHFQTRQSEIDQGKGGAQEEEKVQAKFKHINKAKTKATTATFGGNLKLPGQEEDNADRDRADQLIEQMKNVTREQGTFTIYAKKGDEK